VRSQYSLEEIKSRGKTVIEVEGQKRIQNKGVVNTVILLILLQSVEGMKMLTGLGNSDEIGKPIRVN
jgi:hypothetical protein